MMPHLNARIAPRHELAAPLDDWCVRCAALSYLTRVTQARSTVWWRCRSRKARCVKCAHVSVRTHSGAHIAAASDALSDPAVQRNDYYGPSGATEVSGFPVKVGMTSHARDMEVREHER